MKIVLALQPPEKAPWEAPSLGGQILGSSPEPGLSSIFKLNPPSTIKKQNPYKKNPL